MYATDTINPGPMKRMYLRSMPHIPRTFGCEDMIDGKENARGNWNPKCDVIVFRQQRKWVRRESKFLRLCRK
uniref:Uncharacterized protein n=1 Tax=Candidozyma auris TaxID=498019 RepID=A0A0L0NUV6_CANAR